MNTSESYVQRKAQRHDYAVHKCLWKHVPNIDNYGDHMLIEDDAISSLSRGGFTCAGKQNSTPLAAPGAYAAMEPIPQTNWPANIPKTYSVIPEPIQSADRTKWGGRSVMPRLAVAVQSTFEALLWELRAYGAARLRNQRTLGRLAPLSTVQLEQLINALMRLQPRYASTIDDKLIVSLKEQIAMLRSDDEVRAALADIKRQREHRERVGRVADKYIAKDGSPPKPTDDDEGVADTKGDDARPAKQVDVLIDLAESATLFHALAPSADAYADVMIDGHRETHRVRGAGFRRWLRHQFFKKTGGGCNSEAMQAAIETIAARAQFEGNECAVNIRVAKHGAGIYIDLGDPDWRGIEITEVGWKVVDEVRFASCEPPAPKYCRFRSAAVQSSYSGHSAI